MQKNNYTIGLDIGTSSVGWAVSDYNGKLLKKKGRNLWGVRLFEEAETSQNRRVNRSQRRRYARRKFRLMHLQELLSNMVLEKDINFFAKLNDSFLHQEDREEKNFYNIFNDKDFTDKHYYEKYKTIYHLRHALSTDVNTKYDPRLIYLALHHIVKYRGHFLWEDEGFDITDINLSKELENDFINFYKYLDIYITADYELLKRIEGHILNEKLNNSKKVEMCLDELDVSKNEERQLKQYFNLIVGLNSKMKTLINDDKYTEDTSINLSKIDDDKFEEELVKLGEYSELVDQAKKTYALVKVASILKDSKFISHSMVQKYEKHNKDLNGDENFMGLKKFIKLYFPEYFKQIFRDKVDEKGKLLKHSYALYIGQENKLNYEDFTKNLKNLIDKKQLDDETFHINKNYILQEIADENFLVKQRTKVNSNLPQQVHKIEFDAIIENQSKFYPELKEIKDKLEAVRTFKVDYYVGPLANDGLGNKGKTPFSWSVRNQGYENEKITPWNYNKAIDKDESATKFIERMTNSCQYLFNEPVLPANSIIYSKYKLLNELNGITIVDKNKKLVSEYDKHDIIENLFKRRKKVTEKHLRDYLNDNHFTRVITELRGFQKENEFASSLSSYIDFSRIFADEIKKDSDFIEINLKMIEKIIYYITILPDDRKMLSRKISKEFPQITNKQLNEILNLKYTGWGALSNKLLNGLLSSDNAGNVYSVLDVLEQTSMVFMQVITSDKYEFKIQIDEYLEEHLGDEKVTYETVANLAGSPAIKRGIWQSLKVVDELVKVIGYEPSEIFIEMARDGKGKKKGKRTSSRQKYLEDLYKKIEDDSLKAKSFINEIAGRKDAEFNNEKLFLYYLQNGKCMYTGKSLNADNLSAYEVDHIIPRSIRVDDSIDNKVLVLYSANQSKGNNLVSNEIKNNMKGFWETLYKNKLITPRKYRNLNLTSLNDEQLKGFIARQLVETRQITKKIAELLKKIYNNTNIHSIKSDLVTDFRNQFGYYKNDGLRAVNDYHHAQDAYLTTVVGNYAKYKFPEILGAFNKHVPSYKYRNIKSKSGFIVGNMVRDYESGNSIVNRETGEVVWHPETVLKNVNRAYYFSDCLITKRTFKENGSMYNETRYSSLKNQSKDASLEKKNKLIPLKGSNSKLNDVYKYGGYSGDNIAYSVIVDYVDNKNNEKKSLVDVNVRVAILKSDKKLNEYILESLGGEEKVKEITNIVDVNKNQLIIDENNNKLYFKGSGESNNAKQLVFGRKNKWAYDYIFNVFDNWRRFERKHKENYNENADALMDFVYNHRLTENKKFLLLYADIIEKEYQIFSQISPVLRRYVESSYYNNLSIDVKEDLVKNLLIPTSSGPGLINLTEFFKGDDKENFKFSRIADFGRITSRLNIEKIKIINESVTGLFSHTL